MHVFVVSNALDAILASEGIVNLSDFVVSGFGVGSRWVKVNLNIADATLILVNLEDFLELLVSLFDFLVAHLVFVGILCIVKLGVLDVILSVILIDDLCVKLVRLKTSHNGKA